MRSCNRGNRRICAEKEKGIPTVKGGKRGGERVYKRIAKEEIYSAVKVTTNGTGILCG